MAAQEYPPQLGFLLCESNLVVQVRNCECKWNRVGHCLSNQKTANCEMRVEAKTEVVFRGAFLLGRKFPRNMVRLEVGGRKFPADTNPSILSLSC